MIAVADLYQLFLDFPCIKTDTREEVKSSLFFCLKGDNFDGNQFALKALALRAAYVITENKLLEGNDRIIVVDDVLTTLQRLANFHRNKLNTTILAITGTNGKTTTKELIYTVLSQKYKVACTKGNLNNHIGVPLTLLSIKEQHQIAIVEMGANHPGEIADLCAIAEPDYGLITNVGHAHLEGFGSYENIIKTKTALYEAVRLRQGKIFINADDALLMQYAHDEDTFFYGSNAIVEPHGVVVDNNPYLTISLFSCNIKTQLSGAYNLYNILAAVAVGTYFGVNEADMAKAIAGYTPVNHRSQIMCRETNIIISDWYNANPDSMKQALLSFASIQTNPKIAILGDMFELGENAATAHLELIHFAQQHDIEAVFVGKYFTAIAPPSALSFETIAELNQYLKKENFQNTMFLVKGSRGMKMEQINL
ncbi:MAG: UDP-N-acetylmuramoyl-tripeptide--D-alanyl-D-alanine ligase [Bacteroidales bacterium]|jgi:UDP-N-acetylmuramoyl-tripeptide--D-alanyl-D-alanine ligase|nr:UDP-N-acetylmuramoyl-tripeptide--D-alanyl-D-alanine ligase [Bacteroidales bacterium]